MLTDDLRRLLSQGAARPSQKLEVGVILRRGRRLKRQRTLAVAAATVAIVLLVGVVTANLDALRPQQRQAPPRPVAAMPEGWTELPLPPEVRGGTALVWTGSQLLAWGGCDPAVEDECVPTADGYTFEPATQRWEPLEAAPTAGSHGEAVWTGTEAIFLGAMDGQSLEGQAYNPATGAWRRIATAPIHDRPGAVTQWSGNEIIVWGGGRHDDPTTDNGAAYDPVNDEWRRIADAPLRLNLASAMWTGREMIVFGSLLNNRNMADTLTSVGAIYDPAADTWREMPPSELSPQATSAVWLGNRMVAWDYLVRSQEYDPDRNAWSKPIKMPLDESECYPDSALVRDSVFAFYCGEAALYESVSSTWEEIHGGPLEEEVRHGGYKLWRFAQLAPTGDTVFFLAEGITTGDSDEVCYGCPGSPVSFWAYRPPE